MKKELNKDKKIKLILKYFMIFLLFYVVNNATIFDCSPFCVALLFALMWTGFNPYVLSVEFLVSCFGNWTLENLYVNIVVVFVMLFVYLLHAKLKKPMNLWAVSAYMMLGVSCYGYYAIVSGQYVQLVVYVVLLLVSFGLFSLVFQLAVLRGVYYKLTLNESIAVVYLMLIIGLGLGQVRFYGFSFVKMVAIFSILFFNSINKQKVANITALSLGVGAFVGSVDSGLIANLVVILLSSCLFKYPQKYYMTLSVLLADCCFLIYTNNTVAGCLVAILPTLIAIVLALAIPNKFICKIQDRFYMAESEMSMRNIVNLTRSNLHRRFNELASVFGEMKAIHLGLIKDDVDRNQLVKLLTDELLKGFCKDCLNKNKCYRAIGDEELASVGKLVDMALKKGKLTLLDIPSNLAIRCGMVNFLIGKINQQIAEYKHFAEVKKDVNNVKYLLAEQIGAVGQIMLDLGNEIDKHICFDARKESQIVAELLQENILCSEVLFYNENESDVHVDLIIKGENAFNPKISEIISKKLKKEMKVVSSKPIEVTGFYAVSLELESNFDIVFGLASYTKTGSEASGDSHSLLRLSKNKYLVALCDGMGSGEEANRTSALTIGLIENFYKAGFDNELIISSINKLLSLNNQENYATLDLCLLDLDSQEVDFIKIGAPFSVIKHETVIEKIEGGALPVGVLDNVKPYSYQTAIDTKSMIVMMTDGVTDAFGDVDEFNEFLKGIDSINPQTIAQTVIDEAVRRTDNVNKDDMTILVVRTFRK